ncbi:MAG: fibronectin type III domain-containing protein [Candidatus Latescibacterota bacterium]|nr:MAG: fibronectin type III domain-containing protein [Candidatus Latescibacterota bacterium]
MRTVNVRRATEQLRHFSKPALVFLSLALSLGILAVGGCGKDETDPAGPGPGNNNGWDTIPPATVTDLRLRSPSTQSLAVVWTAPGDDGMAGTARRYDIRYSKSSITDTSWDSSTPVDASIVPTPKPAGNVETMVLLGLDSGTEYFFALKTSDEVPNVSDLSNCPSGTTLKETIPPDDISDLVATAIDDVTFVLNWTAPGDDGMSGTAAQYDIRYSRNPILDETNWDSSTPVAVTPPPNPAGFSEEFTVTGLDPHTNYFFVVKTGDEIGNWSGLSNNAPGLALSEFLLFFPSTVYAGENLNIAFRASADRPTMIALHRRGTVPVCGQNLFKVLVNDVYPDGVHYTTYDFFDPNTGEYVPEDSYPISLCWGSEMKDWQWVNFRH